MEKAEPAEKVILLLSDHPDDATFVSEVAQVVGATLIPTKNAKETVDILSDKDIAAIFIDADNFQNVRDFEMEVQQRFGFFSDRVQPDLIHFTTDKELSESRDLILSPLFGNFYQRRTDEISMNGQFYGRFVRASEKKVTHELKNFLGDLGKVQTITLDHTNQKQEAAEAVRQYLIAAKIPARMANIVANAVDELLMNAMFDAPCDAFGKPLFSSTVRSQARDLQGQEKVLMSIGFDGFYMGVSVTDLFGSLDRGRLLQHISANYRDRDYTIRSGQAGAGLGLASVFNTGGSLIYHCEARAKTETTLLYRGYSAYKDFKNQFKFFSARFYV